MQTRTGMDEIRRMASGSGRIGAIEAARAAGADEKTSVRIVDFATMDRTPPALMVEALSNAKSSKQAYVSGQTLVAAMLQYKKRLVR